ncbi:MAG: hypothetical protein V3T56_09260 [Gemmatimonadales bacterium]
MTDITSRLSTAYAHVSVLGSSELMAKPRSHTTFDGPLRVAWSELGYLAASPAASSGTRPKACFKATPSWLLMTSDSALRSLPRSIGIL